MRLRQGTNRKRTSGLKRRRTMRQAGAHGKKRRRGNAGKATAYDHGYDAGYNDAQSEAKRLKRADNRESSQQFYEKGIYDGGEGVLETKLPFANVLPEIGLMTVIATGLRHLEHCFHKLMDTEEVFGRMRAAMDSQTPLSVVRLGDGETLTLAQDLVMSSEEVKRAGPFLPYAGIEPPDLRARDQLADAVRRAGIVGIPTSRKPLFQPLLFSVLRAHGIAYRDLSMTYSTINYKLCEHGWMRALLKGRSVLTVGNNAGKLADLLKGSGITVSDSVAPVRGVADVPAVLERIRGIQFDIALIAAGIPAVLLAVRVADEMGKVALDFGHLADLLIKGEAKLT